PQRRPGREPEEALRDVEVGRGLARPVAPLRARGDRGRDRGGGEDEGGQERVRASGHVRRALRIAEATRVHPVGVAKLYRPPAPCPFFGELDGHGTPQVPASQTGI